MLTFRPGLTSRAGSAIAPPGPKTIGTRLASTMRPNPRSTLCVPMTMRCPDVSHGELISLSPSCLLLTGLVWAVANHAFNGLGPVGPSQSSQDQEDRRLFRRLVRALSLLIMASGTPALPGVELTLSNAPDGCF